MKTILAIIVASLLTGCATGTPNLDGRHELDEERKARLLQQMRQDEEKRRMMQRMQQMDCQCQR